MHACMHTYTTNRLAARTRAEEEEEERRIKGVVGAKKDLGRTDPPTPPETL